MPASIICPTACPDCPLGELRSFMIYCRYYRRSTQVGHDGQPEYCRVEKVIIEEGEEC